MLKIKDLNMDQLFKDYMVMLLENGFQIYVSETQKGKKTFCKIVKENKIGSVEADYYGGLNFGTVHKPSKHSGTGFSIAKNVYEPTIELAEQTFLSYPWKTSNTIIKHKNFDEYLKQVAILNFTEVCL